MDLVLMDRMAVVQHGLVTRQQLLEAGASHGFIRSSVALGRLERIRKAVYRVAGAPPSRDQALLAAVLEVGGDAVISHHTAAAFWGFRGFEPPNKIDVLTTTERPRTAGVLGHMTQRLPDHDRTRLRGVPVTTPERSIIDASGGLHPWWLRRVLDDAARRKIITYRRLHRAFESVPPSGRRPSRAMREALRRRPVTFEPGGSAAELDVLDVLRAAGVAPLPRQQHRVEVEGRRYRLDFAWPDTRHAIEFDHSWVHGDASSFHDDRERLRRLARAGWVVWPVTERTSASEIVRIGRIAMEGRPR